jgi:ankyrin repeat protein
MIAAGVALGLEPGARDATGQTPLYCACEKGHVGAARALLAAGADPNVPDAGDNGVTPLRRAAACGHVSIIQLLVTAGASLDWASKTGNNALHDASYNGRADSVRALLAAGASVGAKDNHAWTALHYAADHGRTDAMAALIEGGADVRATKASPFGSVSCLAIASAHGHGAVVKVLKRFGAKK